jgi:hypothetical protein
VNDSIRAARTAVVVVLMAAACSGGGRPASIGSSSSPSAVAYSACMRSHGVPNFPDPGSGGAIPKGDAQHFGVGTAQFQSAQHACQQLIPPAGSLDQQSQQCFEAGDCPPAVVQQILTAQRRYAACMRSHGLPKFPDPVIDSEGRPVFAWSISKTGMDPHSAQYEAKEDICQRQAPAPEARQVDP